MTSPRTSTWGLCRCSARVRRGEPRFAGAGAEPSPALGRLPRNAWPSNSDRRNLRRSGPLHRRVLPGGELAGAGPHPRLCPQARHARDLGPPRQTEGGPGLPAGPRRARANCAASTMPQSGEAKATRDRGPLIDCEACGSVFMVCPISAARAGDAIRWPPSWPSRSPRSLPDTTVRPQSASSPKR